MRAEQQRRKQPPEYDRRCRESAGRRDARRGAPRACTPVVRFKMPLERRHARPDFLRGEIEFENATLDDFVLLKSDGFPTYHLASIVDDHVMEITHVLRGDEWIPQRRHAMCCIVPGVRLGAARDSCTCP